LETFSDEERALVRRFAAAIVDRRMALPATLFLESMRPMNFVGSQALHFFNPVLSVVFSFKDLEKFALFLEKRESLELVVNEIESLEEVRHEKEREERRLRKEERRRRRQQRGAGRWWPPW
jgi:hypothetical protein